MKSIEINGRAVHILTTVTKMIILILFKIKEKNMSVP